MTDNAVVSDRRMVHRGGVNNGSVLDAGSLSNDDCPIIATQDGTGPDGTLRTDGD